MKSRSLLFALSILLLVAPACRKSEIDEKPAAEVTDTATDTTSTVTADAVGKVIKDQSKVEFVGAKVTRDHQGKFHNFDGSIGYQNGKPAQVNFDIDLSSIETDEEKLTAHLKTPDFFDVARYPKATFASTSLTEAPAGSAAGTTHLLKGNLTMHGVTREVTVPVVAQTTAEGVRAKSEFTINRHDWGISYRGMADDLIKDNVLIRLDLLFPPPPAQA